MEEPVAVDGDALVRVAGGGQQRASLKIEHPGGSDPRLGAHGQRPARQAQRAGLPGEPAHRQEGAAPAGPVERDNAPVGDARAEGGVGLAGRPVVGVRPVARGPVPVARREGGDVAAVPIPHVHDERIPGLVLPRVVRVV